MRTLVGSTGFIGTNLRSFLDFDFTFNSKNINDIESIPDGSDLYLSCLPATKWKINKHPLKDLQNILDIFSFINNHKYRNVYLFSTIDVYYDLPKHSDENSQPSGGGLGYGQNRHFFEVLVANDISYEKIKIIRLPGIHGPHLKKNILFDIKNNNEIQMINRNSMFQWYNIERLMFDLHDIEYINSDIFNLFPEPVETQEIVDRYVKKDVGFFGKRSEYDYKTIHTSTGYWYDKETSLREIGGFLCGLA